MPVVRLTLFILLTQFSPSVLAAGERLIDMHFHAWPHGAEGPPEHPKNIEHMQKSLQALKDHNVVLAATSGPQAFLEYWSAQEPQRLLLGPIFPCDGGVNPNWYQQPCFADGAEMPDIEWLESQYSSGNYGVMGELMNQYAGIPYDDPRMTPYYELAQRYGIPVAFHMFSAPPGTAKRCCPKFRMSLGDPIKLEEVLIAYPKLKVQIMHANPLVYPIVLEMMTQYPQIYVDLTPFQKYWPRSEFHEMLRRYKSARMIRRVMFGTDGDDYDSALEAYTSAEFLTDKDLSGIFCENAARFLQRKQLCDAERAN
jgi:hypothetical protein